MGNTKYYGGIWNVIEIKYWNWEFIVYENILAYICIIFIQVGFICITCQVNASIIMPNNFI